MERPQNVLDLVSGPENLTFPKIPANADSMALALKGKKKILLNVFLIFFRSLGQLLRQRYLRDVQCVSQFGPSQWSS